MNTLKKLALACTVALASWGIVKAARVVYSQTLVSETALAYNNTYTLDMGASILPSSNIDQLSMQAVYSSATVSAVTFVDGTKSTGTITVSSYTALVGARATNTLTVSTNTLAAGKYFVLNGYTLLEGDLWTKQGISTQTAQSITDAINTYGAVASLFSAARSSNVVTITVISTGTLGNSYTLSSSSNTVLTVGAANFSGGLDNAALIMNGVALTQGTDWTAVTNASTTAKNISDAIQANSSLSPIIASTWTAGGVVTATSTAVGSGTQYSLWSSTPAALAVSNNRLFGGTDSAINLVTDRITSTAHGLTNGLAVLLTKTAGTIPGGLTTNVTYYAVRSDANSIQLSSGTTVPSTATVNITGVTGGGTFVLTPLGITGTPAFKWEGSNDNANWSALSVSSVTMSSYAPATTMWDFGTLNYRYVRLNVVAPATGGINLVVTGIGKSSQ